jgi:cytochrome c oxidase cbb3-type subunit 2
MPAYPWMFTLKKEPAQGDVIVNVPVEYLNGKQGKVVANKEALYLVAYLQALKQVKLPDGSMPAEFLYKKEKEEKESGSTETKELNGAALYTANCQSCHQENGEGLKGAFPPLKGSKIVLDDNPEIMIDIIMNGYNGRAAEGFGVMPPVGTMNNLNAEEITAIINHEKTSWGNHAKQITSEEVSKIVEFIKQKQTADKK